MGRFVSENGKFVYKYVFGKQDSEQWRIEKELEIGQLEEDYDFYYRSDCSEEEWNEMVRGKEEDISKTEDEEEIFTDKSCLMGDTLSLNYNDIPELKKNIPDTFSKDKKKYDNFWEGKEGASFSDLEALYAKLNKDFFFWLLVDTYIKHMEAVYNETKRETFHFYGEM